MPSLSRLTGPAPRRRAGRCPAWGLLDHGRVLDRVGFALQGVGVVHGALGEELRKVITTMAHWSSRSPCPYQPVRTRQVWWTRSLA